MDHLPIRSALFVPGNRPERFDKAMGSGADAVIVDLEDAVPMDRKEESRANVRQYLMEKKSGGIVIRVNSPDSGLLRRDLEAIAVPELWAVMLAKTETVAQVDEIDNLLSEIEGKTGKNHGEIFVVPLIESARGVRNVHQIFACEAAKRRVLTASFGAADYALDMGIELTLDGTELIYPRSRIAVACRAAELDPPLDTPFVLDIKNVEAVRADARRAKQFGFQGKLCIHPLQVEPCNTIFMPTPEEIDQATKVVEAFRVAEGKGEGAVQLDGKFIDPPVVGRSRRILELASLIGRR